MTTPSVYKPLPTTNHCVEQTNRRQCCARQSCGWQSAEQNRFGHTIRIRRWAFQVNATLLFLMTVCSAPAGQVVEVEPGGTYNVRASQEHLTAIGMADGLRLQEVFGMDTSVSISKDDSFGRAIIRPLTKKPFSIIVTDENGDSYSLAVTPVAGPGDVITLKRSSHKPNEALKKAERDMPYLARLKRTVKRVVSGHTPAGYQVKRTHQVVPLWVEAKLTLVMMYEGAYRIEHYQLVNVSPQEMRLDEREFSSLGDLVAVSVRHHVLAPGEATDVYIVRSTVRRSAIRRIAPRSGGGYGGS